MSDWPDTLAAAAAHDAAAFPPGTIFLVNGGPDAIRKAAIAPDGTVTGWEDAYPNTARMDPYYWHFIGGTPEQEPTPGQRRTLVLWWAGVDAGSKSIGEQIAASLRALGHVVPDGDELASDLGIPASESRPRHTRPLTGDLTGSVTAWAMAGFTLAEIESAIGEKLYLS